MPGTIRLADPQGTIRDVPTDAAASALDAGWTVPTTEQELARTTSQAKEAAYGGVGGTIKAGLAAGARGATLGLSDLAARGLGGEDTAIALEGYREAHPYVSTGAEFAGALAPAFFSGGAALPAGAVGGIGRATSAAVGGGLRGSIAGGAVEGGLFGAGQAVSNLSLSRDPVTLERVAGELSSNVLFGAATGGIMGAGGNALERGLTRAGSILEERIAARQAASAVSDDLAQLDAKGLTAARNAEIERLAAAHDVEKSAARSAAVDDALAYRSELKEANPWLVISDGDESAQLAKANKAIRTALADDPKGLRESPGFLLKPLRKEEQALEGAVARKAEIAAGLDEIDAKLAAEIEGAAPKSKPAPREMPSKEFDDWTIELERKVTGPEWTAGDDYQNGAFGINYALRTGEVPADYPLVKNLDSRIEKSILPSDTVLYRGVQGDEVYEKLSALKPGDSFVEKGYTSTAVSPSDAHGSDDLLSKNGVTKEQYKEWKGIQLEIEVPKGGRGAALPWNGNFGREVVLPRNQQFTVRGVEHYPDGQVRKMRLAAAPQAAERTPETWKEFVAGKMSEYMKSEGGHAGAMKRLSREWGERAAASAPIELSGRAARRYAAFSDTKLPKGGTVTLDPSKAGEFLAALKSGEVASDSRRALDSLDGLLEHNRAVQNKIKAAAAPKLHPSELKSDRLAAIEAAKDTLSERRAPSLLERAASGAMFGAATGVAASLPLIGQIPGVAHLIGAKAAETVTGLVFGRGAKAVADSLGKTKSVVDVLANATREANKVAPVVATKTLQAIRYGSKRSEDDDKKPLPELFRERSEEIKRLTEYDATGTPRLRPEARERMAQLFKPIAAVDPIAADRLETIATRRIEYLSSKIPRQPDMGTPMGFERWHPSDMDMAAWARSVAAAEDPHGVEQRAAAGALTPEDAEAYWAIYPERAQHFKMTALGEIGSKKASIPFERKLALSMLFGQPLDPSLHPRVLAKLQGQFPAEPGTSGGTAPPRPQPQFGSIKKEPRTPAQERAAR